MYKQKKILFFKILLILFIFLLFLISCVTFADKEYSPELNFTQNYKYISPNNDGIQDELILNINIKNKFNLSYWEIEVIDDTGSIMMEENSGGNFEELKKKIFLPKDVILMPRKLTWDGYNMSKENVSDDKYTFNLIIMDNKKNIAEKKGFVFVDTVNKGFKYEIQNKVFSPNDDGNKDSLSIKLDIEKDNLENKYEELIKDRLWYIDILDNQNTDIKRFVINQIGEREILWSGLNNTGKKVNDGNYIIKIHSKDFAGNYWEGTVNNIIIDTKEEPVEIYTSSGVFSPNNDGVKDTIDFNVDIADKTRIDKWKLIIQKSEMNNQVRIFQGSNIPSDTITWDGKNSSGEYSKEGFYKGFISIYYLSGITSSAETQPFKIDVTKPSAKIQILTPVFSPDNNNVKDKAIISQSSSSEKTKWLGFFYNQQNSIVKKIEWYNNIPEEIKWDGNNSDNNLSEDGIYYYQLECTDLAGNAFKSKKEEIQIYTEQTPVFISATNKTFSPNNDKILDVQIFKINCIPIDFNPVEKWNLIVKNSNDAIIYKYNGKNNLPEEYIWNGKIDKNIIPGDGGYEAFINVYFKQGTSSTAESDQFFIDITPPKIEVIKDNHYFSPDNDGINDKLTFNFINAEDMTGIKNWELAVLSTFSNKEFAVFNGNGKPKGEIIWDGKGNDGRLVESAEEYPVQITSEDLVGNKEIKKIDPVLVDILVEKLSDGRYKIRVSSINFKPDLPIMTDSEKNIEILDMIAGALEKFPDHKILIEGYANRWRERLSEKIGYELSNDRAVLISNELNNRGIEKDRISVIGRGFEEPIIPLRENMTYEEKLEMGVNRRVEFYLEK